MKNKTVLMVSLKSNELDKLLQEISLDFSIQVKRPHITIRGPYSNKISKRIKCRAAATLQKIREETKGFLIEGIGIFHISDTAFVYLQVKGNDLRPIWWKPDFPIGVYGFNPHVTLVETTPILAQAISNFIKSKDIHFYVSEFELEERVLSPQATLEW